MPKSLSVIEKAASLLEMASQDLRSDPFSQAGRDKLISGSRGILQGTTTMLVVFDESQVSCKDGKKTICITIPGLFDYAFINAYVHIH